MTVSDNLNKRYEGACWDPVNHLISFPLTAIGGGTISGSGTAGRSAVFTGASAIGNGNFTETATTEYLPSTVNLGWTGSNINFLPQAGGGLSGLNLTFTDASTSNFSIALHAINTATNATNSSGGAIGIWSEAQETGAGNIPSLVGLQAHIRNGGAGTVADAYSLFVQSPTNNGGGIITNEHGVYVSNLGTPTNSPKVFEGASQADATAWGLYVGSLRVEHGPWYMGSDTASIFDTGSGNPVAADPNGSLWVDQANPGAFWERNNGQWGLIPTPVGASTLTGQTTALGPTTLTTVGGSTNSFLVVGQVVCDTSVATATVSLTINYTDSSNTAQSIAPAAAVCTTLGAASFAVVNTPIRAKNATTITYTTAIANSPNYDVSVQLYRLSTN